MRRMIKHRSLTVSFYDDDTVEIRLSRYDPAARVWIPHLVSTVEQPARDPFTPEELLLMGAMEMHALWLDQVSEVP
jgi:hypothetical protein